MQDFTSFFADRTEGALKPSASFTYLRGLGTGSHTTSTLSAPRLDGQGCQAAHQSSGCRVWDLDKGRSLGLQPLTPSSPDNPTRRGPRHQGQRPQFLILPETPPLTYAASLPLDQLQELSFFRE